MADEKKDKVAKVKGRVILSTPGFSDITTTNIAAYKAKVEKFLVDRQFGWFLSDTLGMTTSWKKGDKFDRFVGAMQDNQKDVTVVGEGADATTVGEICMNLEILANQVAEIDPRSIIFEDGSGAQRDYGKAIDRKIEKEQKTAAVAAAVNQSGVEL